MRTELRDCERDALRFRALITASNDVVYRMSPDWSTMRQLQGQGFLANTETDNPRWFQEYIPDSDKAAVTSAIQEAVRTKGVFELEHGVYREDGTVGLTHSRAVPLLLESLKVCDAAEVVAEALQSVVDFSGNRLGDDLAILAFRRVGPGEAAAVQRKFEM